MLLNIAVAAVMNQAGKTLLVRKRGTEAFMQPGGKIEPGETPEAALARELAEELDIEVAEADLKPLGTFRAEAANEPDTTLEAVAFELPFDGTINTGAEIEDAVWVDPDAPGDQTLAPLTERAILPLLCGNKGG